MTPQQMGLLGMAGAMLTPGQGLGQGFQGYQQGLAQGTQLQGQQLYQQAMQRDLAAREEERRMKIDAAKRSNELEQQIGSLMGIPGPAQASQAGVPGSPMPQMSATGGQTIAQMSPADKQRLAYMMMMKGFKSDEIGAMFSAGNLGRAEVARTVDGRDDLGNPVTMQYDKYGKQVGSGVAKPVEMKFQDLGGRVQQVNPYTGSFVGSGMDKTATPDALVSASTARRGQDISAATAIRGQDITARGQDMTHLSSKASTVDGLRKEFASLPEVKNFKEIIPAQQSATDAVERNTPQADINLIYATAKIFDPTSVVREGEYATVNNSQAPAERFQGLLSHLQGGGRLTPTTRQALLTEINSRAQAGKASYDAARAAYEPIVASRGINPVDVLQDLAPLAKGRQPAAGMPSISDIDAELARRQGR
mgnify:FL=1